MKFVDREPVAAVSLALGLFGFSLPLIVPPIRQSLGYTTKQVPPILVFSVIPYTVSLADLEILRYLFFFPPRNCL